jgi:hypothetical protein
MNSVVSSLWSLVGFGQRRRLETAELALRAALAERDEYLRQLNDALAACEESRRQCKYFRSELELRAQQTKVAPAPQETDAKVACRTIATLEIWQRDSVLPHSKI